MLNLLYGNVLVCFMCFCCFYDCICCLFGVLKEGDNAGVSVTLIFYNLDNDEE